MARAAARDGASSRANGAVKDGRMGTISGHVRNGRGMPLDGLRVRAYWYRPGRTALLGDAPTRRDGAYEIRYALPPTGDGGPPAFDLRVEVSDEAGRVLARPQWLLDAGPAATVDVTAEPIAGRERPLYDEVTRRLAASLPGVPPDRWTDDDVAYAIRKAGLDEAAVAHYRAALALGVLKGLSPQFLFALFRQGLPTGLGDLAGVEPGVVKRAVEQAVKTGLVGAEVARNAAASIAALQKLAVEDAAGGAPSSGRAGAARLLRAAGLTARKQEKFLRLYLAHAGPRSGLWAAVAKDRDLRDEKTVAALRLALGVQDLVPEHPLLAEVLMLEHRAGRLAAAAALVSKSAREWTALLKRRVDGQVVGVPDGVPGRTAAEKLATYATDLTRRVGAVFPTAKLARDFRANARRIRWAGAGARADIARFFAANPEMDFGAAGIARPRPGEALSYAGVRNRAQLTANLKKMQRVYRIAPRAERFPAMNVLLQDGLDSAWSIARLGRGNFGRRYAARVGGGQAAAEMYMRASYQAGLAVTLVAELSPDMNRPGISAIPEPTAVDGIPQWRTLFGGLDYCECRHCDSVTGPAAYLADLLHFLMDRPSLVLNRSALDILVQRRPDLVGVELTCRNTETPLPYIDLVNETLENALAPFPAVPQTTGTAEELRANPEHYNAAALTALTQAVHPFTLPFSLWAEEARVYLDHLGVSRAQLMKALEDDPAPQGAEAVGIAAEFLGLTPAEWRIIAGLPLNPARTLREYWGEAAAAWVPPLRRVPAFLRKTRLEFKELLQLLSLDFVNPNGAIRVAPAHTCAIEQATLPQLGEAALARIHRFLRLHRRLGWDMRDLDRAIAALGQGTLDEAFLLRLARAEDLRRRFKLPVPAVLALWSNLSTRDYTLRDVYEQPSFYDQLFLNRSVDAPPPAAFQLGAARAELAAPFDPANPNDPARRISTHIAAIAAALRTEVADIEPLLQSGAVADELTLAGLSRLFRIAVLARALGLAPRQLVALIAVTGIEPFDLAATQDTVRLVDVAAKIKASAFDLGALDYLLRHETSGTPGIATPEEELPALLDEIHTALARIAADNAEAPDPAGERTARTLLQLVAPDRAARLLAVLEGTSAEPVADQRTLIDDLARDFPGLLDAAQARAQLIGPPPALLQSAERFQYVLSRLLQYVTRTASERLITQRLAVALGVDVPTSSALLIRWVHSPVVVGRPALQEFLLRDPGVAADFDALRLTYLRLHKVAALVLALKLEAEEVEWIIANGGALGWLNVNELPVQPPPANPPAPLRATWRRLFDGWERLVDLVSFRDSLPAGEPKLFDVLDRAVNPPAALGAAARRAAFVEALSQRTGWPLEDVRFLTGPGGFDLAPLADLASERNLVRLRTAMGLLRRLGLPAEEAWAWRAAEVTSAVSQAIKRAVKARYESAQWLRVAAPLRDVLREKERAALVDRLLARDGLERSDALFAQYLIDPEMSACQLTSRVRQALSSVQLFVQRCFMNLERDVALSGEDADEWRWRRSYRVWEANRKVFLYPENWIEPELRDDKSQLFERIENELLQNEVTSAGSTEAYRRYIEGLDEVARLEIQGVHRELNWTWDPAGPYWGWYRENLHVFARTRSEPRLHYYRWQIDEARWTPWERVDLDIEGRHLVPCVLDRRLYLFWPIFSEGNSIPPDANQPNQQPQKSWEVRLAWSERKNGRWTPKKASPKITLGPFAGPEDLASVSLRALAPDATTPPHPRLRVFCDFQGHRATFELSRVDGSVSVSPALDALPAPPASPRLAPHLHREYQAYVEDAGDHPLVLPVGGGFDRKETILGATTPGRFRLAYEAGSRFAENYLDIRDPFFYEDQERAFYVRGRYPSHKPNDEWLYHFRSFHHPYVNRIMLRVSEAGVVEGLLQPSLLNPLHRQRTSAAPFGPEYQPTAYVNPELPREIFEFDYSGAYASYNWELFFHLPLLIAQRLSRNQRFEEAQRWFHTVFNPLYSPSTDPLALAVVAALGIEKPAPQRFWHFAPFYAYDLSDPLSRPIQELLQILAGNADPAVVAELEKQVAAWQRNPFNPHLIARLRPVAYQKAVVMKYLDNLIAWGDHLFRADTLESINEATQIYLLAAGLLGERPRVAPEQRRAPQTFDGLRRAGIDAFSNAVVEIENYVPEPLRLPWNGVETTPPLPLGSTLYFCIPQNEKLLGYWDTVEDRLAKIRRCLTLEGVQRQLRLFEPPIDPAVLVQAAAGGDFASGLADLSAALPHYRFPIMIQKAVEFCADVRNLGAALLGALEKKDAAALNLARAQNEVKVLNAVREVKREQVRQAQAALDVAGQTRRVTEARHQYYMGLQKISAHEKAHLDQLERAQQHTKSSLEYEFGSNIAHLFPDITVGSSGIASPVLTAKFGGSSIGLALSAMAKHSAGLASDSSHRATTAGIRGGWERRWEEWKAQEEWALRELAQLDKQIDAAKIALNAAEKDLASQEMQIETSRETERLMREMYTATELYDWTIGQVSALYFQSYQLAYDVAKRAERAFRFERGTDASFVRFGYWDSLRRGLLAGDQLHHDLRRLDLAYLEQNKREYEISKDVSLAQLDPLELVRLKETGQCYIDLGEEVFDLDYPGHYARRLRSVSLTIPCVTGPFTSVNCRLTLQRSSVRADARASVAGSPYVRTGANDPRFRDLTAAIQSITTSRAVNDAGLFEQNLRDDRYLPFEGAGAISLWHLDLDPECNRFDRSTITDVILHLRYTASEGGELLRDAARREVVRAVPREDARYFSARHEFSTEWYRFLNPPDEQADQELALPMAVTRLPYPYQGRPVGVVAVELFLLMRDRPAYAAGGPLHVILAPPNALPGAGLDLVGDPGLAGVGYQSRSYANQPRDFGDWTLRVREQDVANLAPAFRRSVQTPNGVHPRLRGDMFEDLGILLHYRVG